MVVGTQVAMVMTETKAGEDDIGEVTVATSLVEEEAAAGVTVATSLEEVEAAAEVTVATSLEEVDADGVGVGTTTELLTLTVEVDNTTVVLLSVLSEE